MRTLDFDRYATFVIIRVLERGSEQDIREITAYYGADRIIDTVTEAPSLMPRAISVSRQLFQIPTDRFKCLKHSPQARHYSMF